MTNVLINNAYNILGLDNTASEKEILKRSRDIPNLLKIDETPEYDSDIGAVNALRTEHSVKDALQNLSDPKKRIKEYFFWFDVQDSVDEEALSNIKAKEYLKATDIWKKGLEGNSSRSFFYKKNLAILYSMLLSTKDDDSPLKESLDLWSEIIKSDKFWDAYVKVYKLNDTLNTSNDVIDNFKKHVPKYLSDIYTELSQKSGNNYHSDFNRVFGVKGEKLEKNVLNPIYNKINDAVEELEAMKISEDGIVDEEEITKVKSLIKQFQEELNKIIDFDLYDDSQTKLIRDRAASALRKIVLDIYNNLRETDKSIALLNIALNISGTASLTHRIEQDIKTLEKNKRDDETVEPILELIKKEKYEDALLLIEEQESENRANSDLEEFYKNHKKMCITVIAGKKYRIANDRFSNKKFDEAKILFNEVIELINGNIDLFEIDKKGLNSLIDSVKARVAGVNASNLDEIDSFREEIRKVANEKFPEQFESTILIFIIDSYIYSLLADFIKEVRNKANVANILYWVAFFVFFWQWWLGLLIAGGAWIYKNKS